MYIFVHKNSGLCQLNYKSSTSGGVYIHSLHKTQSCQLSITNGEMVCIFCTQNSEMSMSIIRAQQVVCTQNSEMSIVN